MINDVPGPGAYSVRDSPKGPKFSIGGALKDELFESKAKLPGPGTYTVKDEVKDRIQGGRFSDSKRPEDPPPSGPGPGQYYPKLDPKGPHYSLKGKIVDKPLESSPGPGAYSPKASGKRKKPKFYLYRKKQTQKQ